MMRKMRVLMLASVLALSAIAVTPAFSYEIERHFCEQELTPDEGCPPNGDSEYGDLYIIEADAGGASHETCDDWYGTVKKNYSAAECMYYAGEEAKLHPGGEYGYPRAWNGGSVTHYVFATEYANS
jgi:hypothetical protein